MGKCSLCGFNIDAVIALNNMADQICVTIAPSKR